LGYCALLAFPTLRSSDLRFPDLSLPAVREVFFFMLRPRRWPHLGASKLSESLHLPSISTIVPFALTGRVFLPILGCAVSTKGTLDRKSTRLNSSHVSTSY